MCVSTIAPDGSCSEKGRIRLEMVAADAQMYLEWVSAVTPRVRVTWDLLGIYFFSHEKNFGPLLCWVKTVIFLLVRGTPFPLFPLVNSPIALMLRLATLPQKLLRSFSTTASASSEPLTLYQYKICPFCCKTKSILSHLSVPFKTVEVNPLNKRQFKDIADVEPLSDYRKVPVAVIEEDGQKRRVDGSDVIIQHILDSTELPGNFANESGMKWLKWSDDHLAPRIYPLLTETFSSSLSSFSYLDDVKG